MLQHDATVALIRVGTRAQERGPDRERAGVEALMM